MVMALLSGSSVISDASGIESPGVGSRALSMGGAFVGLADDWSAAFWNPAGLARLQGWGVGQSTELIELKAHDGNSIANPTPPFTRANIEQGDPFFQLGGEPSHFNVTDARIQAALPSLAGYKVIGPWAFSMGVFAPLGYAFSLEDDTVQGLRANYESRGYVISYNLSAARRFGERWSLGVGFNVLDAQMKRDATKQSDTYTFQSSASGRGNAFQGVVGLLGKLHEKVTVGFVYKTGGDINLHGTSSISDTRFPLPVPGVGTLNNETSATTSVFYNPPIYQAGLAFKPLPALTLTADWHLTDWRGNRTVTTFADPGVFLQNQDFNAGWRMTQSWRTGGEYGWSYHQGRKINFRWGYMWDPYALPDSAVSVTNIVDVSRNFYTIGMSWTDGTWEPAIGFMYDSGSRQVQGVDYKRVDRLVTVGFQYRGS